MDPNLQISRDASRALEEFSDEFREALTLADFELWAEGNGLVRRTDALKTNFPLPLDAVGYHEFKGDHKFRTLYARSMQMTTRVWQDGVEEFAHVIEAPDFGDWAGQPAKMAHEWSRLPNVLVAEMLASGSLDGPLLSLYRDPDTETAGTRRLFAADHPYNILKPSLGDFDNRLSVSAADIASGAAWDAIADHFRSILGPNGRPLGLRFGYALVPSTRETLFKNALEFDTLIRNVTNAGAINGSANVVSAVTQNNRHKGTFGYTVADELADQDTFYALAAGKPGMFPWAVQQETSPQEFIWDKSSERYMSTLKVAFSSVGRANVAAALPHCIARVTIT
jgi:hypothetical protein